jgi:hypothetical protein
MQKLKCVKNFGAGLTDAANNDYIVYMDTTDTGQLSICLKSD